MKKNSAKKSLEAPPAVVPGKNAPVNDNADEYAAFEQIQKEMVQSIDINSAAEV